GARSSVSTAVSATANARATTPGATIVTRRRALPNATANRKPTSGSAGISHSVELRITSASCIVSPAQDGELVGVDRRTVAERGDDDREADRGFGGGDRHHEEHDHLAVHRAELTGERDERQVDRVQHELDRHEDDDDVAAHEHADRADREE